MNISFVWLRKKEEEKDIFANIFLKNKEKSQHHFLENPFWKQHFFLYIKGAKEELFF